MIQSATVYLSVDRETARRHIVDRVGSVRTVAEKRQITIRSNTGVVLATLIEHQLASGERRTRFRYRTSPRIPLFATHIFTVRKIKRAVDHLEVSIRSV